LCAGGGDIAGGVPGWSIVLMGGTGPTEKKKGTMNISIKPWAWPDTSSNEKLKGLTSS